MSVEQELQDIIDEETYSKEIKDLSETERAKIVRELRKYEMSESFETLVADEKKQSEEIAEWFIEELLGRPEAKLEYSQCYRDYLTLEYMETVIDEVNETEWGKAFKLALGNNARQFNKTITERIEMWYDAPAFTKLDIMKHNSALRTSVKVWLSQTISAYEKVSEVKEEQGAY